MIVANAARIDRRPGLLSNLYRLCFNLRFRFKVWATPFIRPPDDTWDFFFDLKTAASLHPVSPARDVLKQSSSGCPESKCDPRQHCRNCPFCDLLLKHFSLPQPPAVDRFRGADLGSHRFSRPGSVTPHRPKSQHLYGGHFGPAVRRVALKLRFLSNCNCCANYIDPSCNNLAIGPQTS